MNRWQAADRLQTAPLIRVEPQRRWALPSLCDIWVRRELIYFLFWRDLRVRYKQAVIGGAWAILSPLLLMGVFTLFFGVIFATPSAGVPRPVFIFSGVLTWLFFAEAFHSASVSLQKDKHLLAKLYFPRLIIPVASVLPSLVDYGLGLLALAAMMLAYHIPFRPSILLLPLLASLVLYIALCVGIWFSALNLQYTDFRHITPLVIQVWFYSTPIFYPASLIPLGWQPLYRLNPMVGVVEAVRWALFGTPMPELGSLLLALVPVSLILIAGAIYFTRVEPRLAEVG